MQKLAALILLTGSLTTAGGARASAQPQPSFAQVVALTVPTKVRTIEGRLRGSQDRSSNAARHTASPAVHLTRLRSQRFDPSSSRFSLLNLAQSFYPSLYAQLLEQRLGVLQVGGVELLREPVVDFSEHRARLVAAIGVAH